jgi:hypothetical protein
MYSGTDDYMHRARQKSSIQGTKRQTAEYHEGLLGRIPKMAREEAVNPRASLAVHLLAWSGKDVRSKSSVAQKPR